MRITTKTNSASRRGWAHAQDEWSPLELSNLVAWYRGDSYTATGGVVDTIVDKSGNGYTLSQSGTTGPAIETTSGDNIPDGIPVFTFSDSANMRMEEAAMAFGDGYTTFTVIAFSAAAELFDCVHDAANLNGGIKFRVVGSAPGFEVGLNANSNNLNTTAPDGTYTTDEFNYYKCSYTSTGGSIEKDGTGVDSNGVNMTPSGTGLRVGQDGAGGGYLNARIAEKIVCSADITGAELTELESYVASRYGI